MIQVKRVEALFHVRKLRGGSQPVLVQASDGFLYVVKFLNNPQGSNLLFNEALGTELFRGAGLPVPEWRLVHISEEFLDRNQACWMELEHGLLRPKAGWCFGSRFLNLRNTSVFEILSRTSFNRISNRRDFCTAWVLDALCGHADNRQAIFIERDTKSLEAFFIDHGHLFGGHPELRLRAFWRHVISILASILGHGREISKISKEPSSDSIWQRSPMLPAICPKGGALNLLY